MAKRTKKLSRPQLKLEALEQRQLLAGVTGGGTEVGSNINHANGNVYDQVKMTGSSVTVTADAGQVTRVSFLDQNDDIVQAEFSGKGTLSIQLDGATLNVAADKYVQPGVLYSKGTASFTIQGADATTNFLVFSVGTATATNAGLFDATHQGGDHNADVQRISIVADPALPNGGTFGSIYAGNAIFSGTNGPVGISAANVQVQGTVTVGDLNATDAGTATLVFGGFSQFGTLKVAGGDLLNSKAINNAGYAFDINLAKGGNSAGTELPAQNTYSQLTFTNSVPPSVALNSPHTYTLTGGIDTITAGTSNDTFIGNNDAGSAMTLSTFDSLNGGDGNDSLSISLTGAVTVNTPSSLTIKNIENVILTSSTATVSADTTGWTGVTTLSTNSVGGATLVASAGTSVIASDSTLAAGTVSIQGGKDITSVSSSASTGNITIGGTTAPKGAVTVTHGFTNAAGGTSGTIAVKGGTGVTITETVGSPVNTTSVIGSITVTGTADTTWASVTEPAKVTLAADKVGVTPGDVTITDVNNGDNSKPDLITTVTLSSFKDALVNSTALTTLNVSGTGVTLGTGGTAEASGVAKATTLALNLNGATITGATTIASPVTTLNVASTGAASTLDSVSSGATAVNVSGDKALTITNAFVTGSNGVITSTNTAGVTIGTALATSTKFTGGDGADSVKLTASFTKAIDMGAGNDTVTYAAATTGGSVTGGAGTDTIVMTAQNGEDVSADATFNNTFSSFEVLKLSDDAAKTINLGGINNVSSLSLAGTGSLVTINNVATGANVTLSAAGGGGTLNVTNALFNSGDVLNVTLANKDIVYGTLSAGGVETVNISSVSGAGSSKAAGQNTLTLTDAAATSIVVTGSNGLILNNTSSVAVTSFDASQVAGEDSNDTAAKLGVQYTSAYTGSSAVTIKGGAGNDVLMGNAKADTITGGAGADKIYGDNVGTKEEQTLTVTYVGASATEKVNILGFDVTYASATDDATSATALKDAINANSSLSGLVTATVTGGNIVHVFGTVSGDLPTITSSGAGDTIVIATPTPGTTGAVGSDVLDGGAGNDVIVSHGGVDVITSGAGADTLFFLKGSSNLASLSTITDFTWASGGSNNDKIVVGDVTAAFGNVTKVADYTVYGTLGAAADAAAAANTTVDGVVVFAWGNDTYMLIDSGGAGSTSYTSTDFLVKLSGSPLAVGADISGKGFDGVVAP